MINLISLGVPIAYLTVLIGSLAVFSSLYRKRKAAKAASLEPWFEPHTARDVYNSLLHTDGPDGQKLPDHVLHAALLLRAKEDIRRVMILRQSKAGLQQLLQRGSVGDDLWTRFEAANAEMDEELRDVAMEANAYKEGWGHIIFNTANEMFNHDKLRERAAQVEEQAAAERKWWDAKKARAQKELLGGEASDSDGVLVDNVDEPKVTPTNAGKKGAKK